MLDGIAPENIVFILVFIEGILSFFSPCVIPLIPVYMGYLAGGGKKVGEDGTIIYERKTVFLHTMFFVLGISFAFFILGMSFTALGGFFSKNRVLFTRIGGILIIIMGLFQLGLFKLPFLQRERKIYIELADKKMNPILALIMGFTFSFAWTPCIGPALSSVLIMASNAATSFQGNLLVFLYALGFLIPFLFLGLFTARVLNFFKENKKFMKYTIKIGGIILIIMGIMTFTGWTNKLSGYLNSVSDKGNEVEGDEVEPTPQAPNSHEEREVFPAFDFTLIDQNGNEHTLSQYKGKVVFMNFWTTWCYYCKEELPDIQALYKEYGLNEEEVVFLGIVNPSSEEYPNNQDVEKEEIETFIEDNAYTFPILFDEKGEVYQDYRVSGFPTAFLIDKTGNIYGYAPGMLSKEIMMDIIYQTQQATE